MSKPLIVTALATEAKPLIEYHKAHRIDEITEYRFSESDEYRFLISGMGQNNIVGAVNFAVGKFGTPSHIFNVGICGAIKDYQIGELVLPNKIVEGSNNRNFFPEMMIKSGIREGTLGTFNEAVRKPISGIDLYDMEGAGFFEAATRFLPPSRISVIKIVSDHLESLPGSKDEVTRLIAAQADTISTYCSKFIATLYALSNEFNSEESKLLQDLSSSMRLSVTQAHQLRSLAHGYKVRGGVLEKVKNLSETVNNASKKTRNDWFIVVSEALSQMPPYR